MHSIIQNIAYDKIIHIWLNDKRLQTSAFPMQVKSLRLTKDQLGYRPSPFGK